MHMNIGTNTIVDFNVFESCFRFSSDNPSKSHVIIGSGDPDAVHFNEIFAPISRISGTVNVSMKYAGICGGLCSEMNCGPSMSLKLLLRARPLAKFSELCSDSDPSGDDDPDGLANVSVQIVNECGLNSRNKSEGKAKKNY